MNQLRYHLYPSSKLRSEPHEVAVIVTEVGVADAIVCAHACSYEPFPRYPPGLLLEVDWETAACHVAGRRETLPDPNELAQMLERHRSG